jgi:hypothetical protein
VHKGLLCWCPIPTAAKKFVVRAIVLAIEAAFSIVLWAMKSRTKDYGMPPLCPWACEDMQYDGCCSHSSIAEHITGEDDGLTLEQIAAEAVEMEQRRSKQKKAAYHEFKALDFQAWQATRRQYAANIDPQRKPKLRRSTEPI